MVVDALWFRTLGVELTKATQNAADLFDGVNPMVLSNDNRGVVSVVNREAGAHRNKTMAIHHFYVKDYVAKNAIKVVHVCSEDNPADIFTKPLTGSKFDKFRKFLLSNSKDMEVVESLTELIPSLLSKNDCGVIKLILQ